MKRIQLISAALLIAVMFACKPKTEMKSDNPFFNKYDTPHGTIPFHIIKDTHYLPAFEEGMKRAKAEVEAIANSKKTPTFDNTIVALDNSGELLGKVSSVFFNLASAETNDSIKKLKAIILPRLTEFYNDINLNEALFARVKSVYNDMKNHKFTAEQKTLIEDTYFGFARNGANLKEEKKAKFREISKKLAKLGSKFGDNVLEQTNAYQLHITKESDLKGLPGYVKEAAALAAKRAKKTGWVITLQAPSFRPFLKFSENRKLREQVYKAYVTRCIGGKFDNTKIIKEIANLRLQRANVLGYNTHADYVLERRMAKSADKVNNFLKQLLDASLPYAKKEVEEVQKFANSLGFKGKLQKWDWSYYTEKLKEKKYKISEEEVKPYFELAKVQKGIFDLAEKLFGITFKVNKNIPVYHEEVTAYDVFDSEGKYLAVFYTDFHPREGKRGGAWMNDYKGQYFINGKDSRPHITNVCNFTRPTETMPSLLTFREVETMLHEFGHGLHGMLSRCHYKGVSGTSVPRDFVELPSQIMENWASEKEWLDQVAVHYKTGEKIPAELVQKIIDSGNFLSGNGSVRQLMYGMTDMSWHSITKPITMDSYEFEKKATEKTNLLPVVKGAFVSPAFGHIFSGGYAAGYYGYKWAEVLDADAFMAFKEKGIFDRATADKFRINILEKGGSEDPMVLYKRFRGAEPSIEPLLIRSGLLKK